MFYSFYSCPALDGHEKPIFDASGNATVTEWTPSVGPFLKALFKLYNISKNSFGDTSDFWGCPL